MQQGQQGWGQPNQNMPGNNRMVVPTGQPQQQQRPQFGQPGQQGGNMIQSFDFNRISEMPSKYPRE